MYDCHNFEAEVHISPKKTLSDSLKRVKTYDIPACNDPEKQKSRYDAGNPETASLDVDRENTTVIKRK